MTKGLIHRGMLEIMLSNIENYLADKFHIAKGSHYAEHDLIGFDRKVKNKEGMALRYEIGKAVYYVQLTHTPSGYYLVNDIERREKVDCLEVRL